MAAERRATIRFAPQDADAFESDGGDGYPQAQSSRLSARAAAARQECF